METVESIEKAVRALSAAQLAEFRHWFAEFDAELWDRQIERDAGVGKLEQLGGEALDDYNAGQRRSL